MFKSSRQDCKLLIRSCTIFSVNSLQTSIVIKFSFFWNPNSNTIFLLVPIYTSILSTEEYGSYDLAVSTATLLFPILTLNIVDAVMRFSMDKDYSKEKIACIGMKFISFSVIFFFI